MSLSIWDEMRREEKIAGIKTCVRAKMTAKEIGVEFHATRNAVIGFASRNKVELLSQVEIRKLRSEQAKADEKAAPKNKTPKAPKAKRPGHSGKRDVKFAIAEPEEMAEAKEYAGPVGIMDLTSHTCRSPLWDHGIGKLKEKVRPNEILFCGKPTKEGSPYCECCHEVYLPKEPPKVRPKQWKHKPSNPGRQW